MTAFQPRFEPLPIDHIDVWYVHAAQASSPDHQQRYIGIMESAERAQAERFVFEADRLEYRIARALVRTTLSRYVDRDPAAWRFSKNRYGRPEIEPATEPRLRFNLSHTRGLIACAVTVDLELGIDAENTSRRDVGPRVAEHFFSPTEVAALNRRPEADRKLAFFEYWTLKESYIKARGMGLSIPLEQFSFQLAADEPVRISFSSAIDDQPTAWQFELIRACHPHLIAVGVKRGSRPDMEIRLRSTIPLDSEREPRSGSSWRHGR